MDNSYQRVGSSSNAHVGRTFEELARGFLSTHGLRLQINFTIEVGVGTVRKSHAFDLGSDEPKVLVECKSHRWTAGGNVPSAKLTVWNEAMYYFHVAPDSYRKIMFVLRDLRHGDGESLAHYYLRTYAHLVPAGIEFWEYDEAVGGAERVGT